MITCLTCFVLNGKPVVEHWNVTFATISNSASAFWNAVYVCVNFLVKNVGQKLFVKEAGTFVCLMESPALLKECGLRCLNVTFYKLIQR